MLAILAYVGPGPGLSMGWALIVLIATVIGSILAVFLWPMRVALRKLRGGGDEADELEADEEEEPDMLEAGDSETAANA